jgi:hypothetical protein
MDAYDAGDEGITRCILNNLCFAITDKSSQAESGAKIDANDLVVHKKIFPASANLEVKCEGPAQNIVNSVRLIRRVLIDKTGKRTQCAYFKETKNKSKPEINLLYWD